MSANTSRRAPDFGPAIARLREIAEQSGYALLTEGPVNPDIELLELCTDALHHLIAMKKAYDTRPWDEQLKGEYWKQRGLAASFMSRAKKLRATTPAGIYAKALCVRASSEGAAVFAMTLAADLLACPGLREALWPAQRVPQ